MSAQPKHIYTVTHMKIDGKLLSWDDHALRISGISHIWAGSEPERPFPVQSALVLLFIALAAGRTAKTVVMLAILALYLGAWAVNRRSAKDNSLVHIGLTSGAVCSFVSPGGGFGREFIRTLTGLMEGNGAAGYEIRFEGDGQITLLTPPEPEPAPESKAANVMEANLPAGPSGRLAGELQKLYQRYIQKNDTGSEILDLINETAGQFARNDKEGINACLTKFVTFGLVNDCNELGLDSLIQEIKNSLY